MKGVRLARGVHNGYDHSGKHICLDPRFPVGALFYLGIAFFPVNISRSIHAFVCG